MRAPSLAVAWFVISEVNEEAVVISEVNEEAGGVGGGFVDESEDESEGLALVAAGGADSRFLEC